MMTSRERVECTLNHREPDRIPLDLGGTPVSGMHVNSVYAIRQALGLDDPGTPVMVSEIGQMLGEIDDDLADVLGVDVVGLRGPSGKFGTPNTDWKPWTNYQGTPVLVPGGFNTELEENGDLLQYPGDDRAVAASGHMPKDGLYFDAIVRQPPIEEDQLDPADNLEEFGPISDEDLEYYRVESARLAATGKAVVANFGGTGFGDIARVPGMQLKNPKGIRDMTEWYTSLLMRRDYIWKVFEGQCAIALENLARIKEVVGDNVTAVMVSGTDFGAQHGLFIALETYRDLFKPFHIEVNTWIHENTNWKTFIHTCGSVKPLIPELIEAGFDALNPVQCSAADMGAAELKREFGKDITFWGGGVDTQRTLPFGTPDAVREEVAQRIRIFGPGGGFVFNTIHNVQAGVPVENIRALYDTVNELRDYPISG